MVNYILNNNAQKIWSVRHRPIGKATFVLYDLVGKEVYRKGIESATNKVTLLVPELSKGVYFYKYSLKNGGQNYSGKLIKE